MKKGYFGRFFGILFTVLVIFAVSACGGGGSEPGDSPHNPINISKNVQLTEGEWKAILIEIAEAGKYVNLDLSRCTRSNINTGGGLRSDGTFDPIFDYDTSDRFNTYESGKRKIVSLILPNAATSIVEIYDDDLDYYYWPFGDNFENLRSISALAVTNIGVKALAYLKSLVNVNIPQATSIGNSAFVGCEELASVSFPKVTSIGNSAFSGCISLASVSFPQVTSIGNSAYPNYGAFYGCISLASVSFPQATSIGRDAFSRCNSLASASFPQATSIDSGAFSGCTSLSIISLPKVISIGYNSFENIGNTPLTINLGLNAPTIGSGFRGVDSAKTVTVKVPSGASGYGTIPGTYTGTGTTENWGNGFRGGGWDGSKFVGNTSNINTNITLNVVYQ